MRRQWQPIMRQFVSIRSMSMLTTSKGNVLSELGRHEEAVAAYNEAIRLNPDDAMLTTIRELRFLAWGI